MPIIFISKKMGIDVTMGKPVKMQKGEATDLQNITVESYISCVKESSLFVIGTVAGIIILNKVASTTVNLDVNLNLKSIDKD